MKAPIRSLAALGVAAAASLPGTASAQSYQVDCAILLCLAGGWPTLAPCAHARAVFIQRITPWPIEPPLQIWRCPMGAAFDGAAPLSPMERLYDITFKAEPAISVPDLKVPHVPVQADERADVDISGDEFDFVRSIRVYHIEFTELPGFFGPCTRLDSTRVGTYGLQGAYRWTDSSISEVPPASKAPKPTGCGFVSYRSVFVDWRDHAGNYGFEEIRY